MIVPRLCRFFCFGLHWSYLHEVTVGDMLLVLISKLVYTRPVPNEREGTESQLFRTSFRPRPRMGDGCRHIFLDVGANRGVHIRSLMEPELFPEALYVKSGFWDEYFGQRYYNDSSVCAFAFEPNVAHAPRLSRLSQFYRAAGRRVEFFPAAVMDKAGTVTMYDHRGDDAKSHWRFGGLRGSHHPVNVSAIHLAAWIKDEIVGRNVPDGAKPPAILMKLDIEGDELTVLESMLQAKVLCAINLITWEYHDYLLRDTEKRYAKHKALWDFIFERQALDDEDEYSRPRHAALRKERAAVQTTKGNGQAQRGGMGDNCSATRFVAKDDEGYLLTPDVPVPPWMVGSSILKS
jgi:FkbM family methyltransferase